MKVNRPVWYLKKQWCVAACIGTLAGGFPPSTAIAQHGSPMAAESSAFEFSSYLRVKEKKNSWISLEIACRTFTRDDRSGPKVALISVAHIADKSFFEAIGEELSTYDVVLYESVMPKGTGGAGGATDDERIASTEAAMEFIAGLIGFYFEENGQYPADIKSVTEFASLQDARVGAFIEIAMIDAWNRPLVYELVPETETQAASFRLASFGNDGKAGGEGQDSDIVISHDNAPEAFSLDEGEGLQSRLAETLELEFQLDALSYDQPNWRCSDLALDEVERRLEARGLDFSVLGDTLAGSSFPAKLVGAMLKIIQMADVFLDGAIADTFKVVLIDMLTDEEMLNAGFEQFGEGFAEVLINDRNQVPVDDLKQILKDEPNVKSVAILYGAAHMPDLAQRLADQLDYANDSEKWFKAIQVDLEESALSSQEINRLRAMIKRMTKVQLNAARMARESSGAMKNEE